MEEEKECKHQFGPVSDLCMNCGADRLSHNGPTVLVVIYVVAIVIGTGLCLWFGGKV